MTETPTTEEKKYLSPSQLESYFRCGEAYRRRYLDGEIIPPAIAMHRGSACHKGAEHNNRQKVETKKDLTPKEIQEVSVESLKDRVKRDGLFMSNDEQTKGKATLITEATDTVASASIVYAEEVAPLYQPTEVEIRERLVLPNSPRDLLGIIDVIDDKDIVIDYKFTAKRWNQEQADSSLAMTFYGATFHSLKGRLPAGYTFENVAGKKNFVRNPLQTKRGPQDFQALSNRINSAIKGIEAGVFTPATPGAWWCGEKYCGFHHTCPYVREGARVISYD